MEKWWKEHADKHDDPEWVRWVSVFSDLLIKKQTEWTQKHSNEDADGNRVFGMSKIAGCSRDTALGLLGLEGEPESGSTNFTFWLGHAVEIAALATLEVIGYHLEDTQAKVSLDGPSGTLFQSASDGVTKVLGIPTVVSVKSSAYKMSGQSKGRWIRRGFAELPFLGVRRAHVSWYAQLQGEMAAGKYPQGLVVVAAKDIMKVFEKDEYLGERGNGSLTFYAEIIKPEIEIVERAIEVHEQQMKDVRAGRAGRPMYMNTDYQYVELQKAHIVPSNIWSGKNQELTGTFNPCGGCHRREVCSNAD